MKTIFVALLLAGMFLLPARAQPLMEKGESGSDALRYGSRCSTPCPELWRPVCASNNSCIKTFSSACVLERENCRAAPLQRYNVIPDHYCQNAKPCLN